MMMMTVAVRYFPATYPAMMELIQKTHPGPRTAVSHSEGKNWVNWYGSYKIYTKLCTGLIVQSAALHTNTE